MNCETNTDNCNLVKDQIYFFTSGCKNREINAILEFRVIVDIFDRAQYCSFVFVLFTSEVVLFI